MIYNTKEGELVTVIFYYGENELDSTFYISTLTCANMSKMCNPVDNNFLQYQMEFDILEIYLTYIDYYEIIW